jgi:hypothetical protein
MIKICCTFGPPVRARRYLKPTMSFYCFNVIIDADVATVTLADAIELDRRRAVVAQASRARALLVAAAFRRDAIVHVELCQAPEMDELEASAPPATSRLHWFGNAVVRGRSDRHARGSSAASVVGTSAGTPPFIARSPRARVIARPDRRLTATARGGRLGGRRGWLLRG